MLRMDEIQVYAAKFSDFAGIHVKTGEKTAISPSELSAIGAAVPRKAEER